MEATHCVTIDLPQVCDAMRWSETSTKRNAALYIKRDGHLVLQSDFEPPRWSIPPSAWLARYINDNATGAAVCFVCRADAALFETTWACTTSREDR